MSAATSLVSKKDITEYIPQKHPIVMIDTLEYCDKTSTKTGFTVDADSIFVKNGRLREPGIIENIAQSAAVGAGYEVKKMGSAPLLGFIGALKNLVIYELPKVGDLLETTVSAKAEVMGVTVIEGVSFCNGIKIAECEMKVFVQKPAQTHA